MPPKENSRLSFIQMANSWMTKPEFKAAFQQAVAMIKAAIAEQDAAIEARLRQLKDGPQGPKGDKGDSIVGPRGPKGEKGDAGPQGPAIDEQAVVQRVIDAATPDIIAAIEKHIPALGIAVHDSLKLLPEGERPHISLFAGLDDVLKEAIRKYGDWSGGSAAPAVMASGVLKAQNAQTMNFTGSGAPTVTHTANGVVKLDFAASGGFTAWDATETPDGSNQVFTFASATAQPTYIIVDNVIQRATTKAGTVNWTWNNSTKQATFSVAPQDDIVAIK